MWWLHSGGSCISSHVFTPHVWAPQGRCLLCSHANVSINAKTPGIEVSQQSKCLFHTDLRYDGVWCRASQLVLCDGPQIKAELKRPLTGTIMTTCIHWQWILWYCPFCSTTLIEGFFIFPYVYAWPKETVLTWVDLVFIICAGSLWSLFPFFAHPGADCDVDSAARFIVDTFVSLNTTPNKLIYYHFTTATDTTNVQVVFQVVMDTIIKENLEAVSLL